jgi:hypothetical protein
MRHVRRAALVLACTGVLACVACTAGEPSDAKGCTGAGCGRAGSGGGGAGGVGGTGAEPGGSGGVGGSGGEAGSGGSGGGGGYGGAGGEAGGGSGGSGGIGEGGSGGGGGTGGEGGTVVVPPEACDGAGLDEDLDGAADCLDSDCVALPRCLETATCTRQFGVAGEGCQFDSHADVAAICAPDLRCDPAGPARPDGTLRRGNLVPLNHVSALWMDPRGFVVRVFHPRRPGTPDRLTCAALASLNVDDDHLVNRVQRSNGVISVSADYVPTPAFELPLPGAEPFLLQVRLYSNTPDPITREPRGELLGDGCLDGIQVPEGDYVADADHRPIVEIEPACSPTRPCTAPKTCVYGQCVDDRCNPACTGGRACREWDGVPTCLVRCNPDDPSCPADQRCDATPGEPAVCVPSSSP